MKLLKNKGFSLIELLISMTILLTVGSLVLAILLASVRSTTKISNVQLIRQNGNIVLTQMSRMIQFSQQFYGVSVDGTAYFTDCETPLKGTGTLKEYGYVKFSSFDNGITTFYCSGTTIASNSASLIDTTSYTVSNCSFTCTQVAPNSPQTVSLSFTLNKKNATNFLQDPTPIKFSTSVTLRNF